MLRVDERIRVGDAQLAEHSAIGAVRHGTEHQLAVALGEIWIVLRPRPARCPATSSSSSHVNWTSVFVQSKSTASITARLG